MRAWLIVGLMLTLAGCARPAAPQRPKPRDDVDAARLAEARRQFTGVLDEMAQGMKLLESQPGRDELAAESKTLHELVDRAADVYPTHEKMADLVSASRMMLRYFDASLKVATFHAAQKHGDPQTARKFIDMTSQANLVFMRELMETLRDKVESLQP
jgi:hypothetical protein